MDVGVLRHATMKSTSASATSNLVHLSVSILASCLQVMIDSEATLNFIHKFIIQQLSLKTTPCQTTQVTLANGRMLIHMTHQVTLHYRITNVLKRIHFLSHLLAIIPSSLECPGLNM